MILSRVTGALQKLDVMRRTLTLSRSSSTQDYEYAATESNPQRWADFVGKTVNIQLCDFLVVDISENADSSGIHLPAREGKEYKKKC